LEVEKLAKQDVDIRTYFVERLPGSRKIVDFLLLNGVNTMEELCEKGSDGLMTALDTALSVRWKYSYEKSEEKLLAVGEMPLYTFFFQKRP